MLEESVSSGPDSLFDLSLVIWAGALFGLLGQSRFTAALNPLPWFIWGESGDGGTTLSRSPEGLLPAAPSPRSTLVNAPLHEPGGLPRLDLGPAALCPGGFGCALDL